LRAEAGNETPEYNTIARGITGTAFLDNSAAQGVEYIYKLKAVDKSGNISEASESITAKTNGEKCLIARYEFDDTLCDYSENMFDAASMDVPKFSATTKQSAAKSVMLTSANNFLQLPYQVGNMREMTICTWINLRNSSSWQRIFDFGSGTDKYMFLTPNNGTGLSFVMKNGGEEEIITAAKLSTYKWVHVAVTIGDDAVKIYINGEEAAASTEMTIRPSDIKPVMNYIGRSQFSGDPLIRAYIDDFRIYNYPLSQSEIKEIIDIANDIENVADADETIVGTEYYNINGTRLSAPQRGVNIVKSHHANGKVSVKKIIKH
jgi:hypothetical protein